MKVGLISDTHGLLRPEALAALRGSDHIVHAGDIGSPEVLERLRAIAPLTAVRGNNDYQPWAERVPERVRVELGGVTFYVLHILEDLGLVPHESGIGVVVSGHSHRPFIERRDGVLYVNPGSAGPRRFRLPVALAHLEISPAGPRAGIIDLQV